MADDERFRRGFPFAQQQQRRTAQLQGVNTASNTQPQNSHAPSALEARLAAQVACAQQTESDAASAAQAQGPAVPLPNLPSSLTTPRLRPTSVSTLAAQCGANPNAPAGSAAAVAATAELHTDALQWAERQFKRAGVTNAVDRAHQIPIQNLAMQQRVRHAQLFNVVERMREGQQHIFLQQFNQFPNVESESADDYSRIWHAFKRKDEEAEDSIARLSEICENIDTLNRHAQHPHS